MRIDSSTKEPRKRRIARALILLFFVMCFLCGTGLLYAGSDSPYPPPAGKVWVRAKGKWVMVPAPPNEGPYRWTGSDWVRINNIPPERKWIPPHWDGDKWVVGHWKVMRSEDENQVWVSGHWANNGQWIEGNWEAGRRSSSGVSDETWIPGVNSPRPPLRPKPPGRPRPPIPIRQPQGK